MNNIDKNKRFKALLDNIPASYIDNAEKEILADLKREKSIKKLKILAPLVACFLLLFFMFSINEDSKKYINSFGSNYKVVQNIQMPDNSKISLDAKSKIDVLYNSNSREIILKEGKALFDVQSNKQRPFFVRSDKLIVQVVGTKFEVNKMKDKTEVSVLEGKVKIQHGSKDSTILALLEKGDVLEISKKGKVNKLYKKDTQIIALWKDKKLKFRKTPLNEVINTFSKYVEEKIELKLNTNDTYPITGDFTTEEFNKFLELLPLIYPIKIEKIKKQRIILKNFS